MLQRPRCGLIFAKMTDQLKRATILSLSVDKEIDFFCQLFAYTERKVETNSKGNPPTYFSHCVCYSTKIF